MKIKVLDTNVLLHSPTALDSFKGCKVVIPILVIEEMDNQKKRQDETGRNARQTIKRLDALQEKYGDNIILEDGTHIDIVSECYVAEGYNLDFNIPDNKIIAVALMYKDLGEDVTFVSNDGAPRVKAREMGLKVQSLEEDRIDVKVDDIYSGWRELLVSPYEINHFYKEKFLETDEDLFTNEFVLIKNSADFKQTGLGKFDGNKIVPLTNGKARPWDVTPRNMEQQFLMDALLNPKIQIVTTIGKAGTGKSLLSIAAGGQLTVEENKYRKMIVYKPVIPMGKDIGYLPGTEEEKLRPWMSSVYDALEFILGEKSEDNDENDKIRYLIDKGYIELSALTYIRGRSLPRLFIIVDEAQNLTPHEIKTIISRVGEDTKIILTGDPYQIDHPYLDSQNNGLSHTVERFKGQEISAHITLKKPERSTLSALAAELL